jgi:hypothetical protein
LGIGSVWQKQSDFTSCGSPLTTDASAVGGGSASRRSGRSSPGCDPWRMGRRVVRRRRAGRPNIGGSGPPAGRSPRTDRKIRLGYCSCQLLLREMISRLAENLSVAAAARPGWTDCTWGRAYRRHRDGKRRRTRRRALCGHGCGSSSPLFSKKTKSPEENEKPPPSRIGEGCLQVDGMRLRMHSGVTPRTRVAVQQYKRAPASS